MVLITAKQYDKALEISNQYNVTLSEDLAKKLFPLEMPPE